VSLCLCVSVSPCLCVSKSVGGFTDYASSPGCACTASCVSACTAAAVISPRVSTLQSLHRSLVMMHSLCCDMCAYAFWWMYCILYVSLHSLLPPGERWDFYRMIEWCLKINWQCACSCWWLCTAPQTCTGVCIDCITAPLVGGHPLLFLWLGLDWIGLDWIGLDWIGLDWIGLDWIGLDWIGLDWNGLDWIGLDWIGLDWIALTVIAFSLTVMGQQTNTLQPSTTYPLCSPKIGR